ncbi:hypothetical protein [Variovorax paradoxus]|uniref:hypothetical protein n=1 Tax=Variovorax paradoxus TaxID=34073 RepID=UPI0028592CAE|nr:hypothetical protein [Variovorax paradoxus]MDR6453892.1 hypothetical protein [Variovorax paradoxus]
MAAVPVGTVIIRDEFTSGAWANGRAPDEGFGGLVYSLCTNGVILGGDVIGTQPWNSGINDHRGVAAGPPIEMPGYRIEISARIVAGAPIAPTNSWGGVSMSTYSDSGESVLEGRASFDGTLGGLPRIYLWDEGGSTSLALADEPNMATDTYYALRVDVGTLRQDYYWNGVLKASTTRTTNLNIGTLAVNIGFSNCGTTSIKVTAIEDIAPPPPTPGGTFHIRDDFLGEESGILGRVPNIVEGTTASWSEDGASNLDPGGIEDADSGGMLINGGGFCRCKQFAF